MVSPGRDQNQTLRLSDFTARQENIQLLQEGNNFDALLRGLVTQLQKSSDKNVDKEVCSIFFNNININVLSIF